MDQVTVNSSEERNAHKLIDSLYLGSSAAISDTEFLLKEQISYVLTVAIELVDFTITKDCERLILKIYDDREQDIIQHLGKGIGFIDESIKKGGRVLVHCVAGRSRSASFCCAYLMFTKNWTYQQAFTYIKKIRHINPNNSFVKQLKLFYKMNFTLQGDTEAHRQYQLERLLTKRGSASISEEIIIPKELHTLQSLDLSYSSLNSIDTLDYLTVLQQLESLNLSVTSISDKNLEGVSKLKNLTDLDISGTFINDKCINYLIPLTNLTRLSLAYTRIAGKTMPELTVLQNLTTLELPLSCAKYEEMFKNKLKKIITIKVSQTDFLL